MADVSGAVTSDTSSSDDSCDKGKEDSLNEHCNGESKSKEDNIRESNITKPSILKTPISSSGFVLRSSKFETPSNNLFGQQTTPKTGLDTPRSRFILNPPKLSNPFLKVDKESEEEQQKSIESPSSSSKLPEQKEDKLPSPPNKTSLSFVPLGGDAPTPSQPNSLTAATTPSLGFVFGQNIHEKVEAAAPAESTSIAAEPSPSKEPPECTSNGTSSEMLFSVRVPRDSTEKTNDTANKSLSEAAREYEEARAVKRKFEEVPILTGEEEEANVLQINCKLFSFSNCTWLERGRGTLRVNDLPTSPGSHRLIVRTAGNFRVVLNTKIWSGMNVDRVSTKSLRLTGMDSNGVIKVFVVMASPKEIDQLQKCLEWRVNNLKKNEESPPKKVKPEDS